MHTPPLEVVNDAMFQLVANSIPQLAWMARPDGHLFWYNNRWYEYTGTTAAEMEGWGWQKVHDPAEFPRVIEKWKQHLLDVTPWEDTFPLRGADGAFRPHLSRAIPLKDANGKVTFWFGTNTDVSDQKLIQRQLTEANVRLRGEADTRMEAELAQARLAAIVASSDDAIISKNLDGTITSWNQAAVRLFGYTSEEIIGKSILTLIPPELRDEEQGIVNQLRQGHRIDHIETQRVTKDGRRLLLSITISPVKDSTGRIIGASKIARDIGERRRAEQERDALLESERHARAEAERAGRLKDDFLATLSHELRTPLNAISGWTQILQRQFRGNSDIEEGLEIIERNCRVQVQLIEDLLDMSRIISGKLKLNVQDVYLPDVIRAAIESVAPAAEAKAVRLTQVLNSDQSHVRGDPSRLQQIVWNLLTNAIKFTPRQGAVHIALQRADCHLEISVTDNGQGIKPDFLPHVFDRFRQADASTTRTHGGLGLGLSIVRQLVELHGGTVHVESAGEGQGASFTVAIPVLNVRDKDIVKPSAFPGSRTEAECDSNLLLSVKVLVVDDEPDARSLLQRVLTDYKATVYLAANATDALEIVKTQRPHVVLSDIGMPGHDGYEFMRWVRSLPADEGGKTPAAALTAFARSEDRRRALLSGYQTHVTKPVEPSEVVAVVASLAGRT